MADDFSPDTAKPVTTGDDIAPVLRRQADNSIQKACQNGDKSACFQVALREKEAAKLEAGQFQKQVFGVIIAAFLAFYLGRFLYRSFLTLIRTRSGRITVSAFLFWVFSVESWGLIFDWSDFFEGYQYALLHILPPSTVTLGVWCLAWIKKAP